MRDLELAGERFEGGHGRAVVGVLPCRAELAVHSRALAPGQVVEHVSLLRRWQAGAAGSLSEGLADR